MAAEGHTLGWLSVCDRSVPGSSLARPLASKIRAARSGDAADREILAHQPGIIGIGIHAVAPRTLADRMAVAPAAREHAALAGLRGRRAGVRRARSLRAVAGVGLQHVVAASMFGDVVIDVVVG